MRLAGHKPGTREGNEPMMYAEFLAMVHPATVSPDDYDNVIEPVYSCHPALDSDTKAKAKLAELFKLGGIGLIRDMLPTAKRIQALEEDIRNIELTLAKAKESKLAALKEYRGGN